MASCLYRNSCPAFCEAFSRYTLPETRKGTCQDHVSNAIPSVYFARPVYTTVLTYCRWLLRAKLPSKPMPFHPTPPCLLLVVRPVSWSSSLSTPSAVTREHHSFKARSAAKQQASTDHFRDVGLSCWAVCLIFPGAVRRSRVWRGVYVVGDGPGVRQGSLAR